MSTFQELSRSKTKIIGPILEVIKFQDFKIVSEEDGE